MTVENYKMDLVEKYRVGGERPPTRSLEAWERDALLRGSPPRQQILKEAHERGEWIRCDCREPYPVLGVRCTEYGKYVLVRLNSRGVHTITCPLYRPVEELDDDSEMLVVRTKPEVALRFHHRQAPRRQTDEHPASREYSRCRHRDSLEVFLATLLEESECMRVEGEVRSIGKQFHALQDAASKFHLDGEVPLAEFFWTHPKGLMRAILKLKRERGRWAEGARPQGVFVVVADEIDGKTVRIRSGASEWIEIEVLKGIAVKGSHTDRSGPYVVGFTLAGTFEKPEWIQPMRGVAIPIVSKGHLFPVWGGDERRVVRRLLEVNEWWCEKGLRVVYESCEFTAEHPVRRSDAPMVTLAETELKLKLGVVRIGIDGETKLRAASPEDREDTIQVIEVALPIVSEDEEWERHLRTLVKEVSRAFFQKQKALAAKKCSKEGVGWQASAGI